MPKLAGIRYHPDDPYDSAVDLGAGEVGVRGKGGKPRTVKLKEKSTK